MQPHLHRFSAVLVTLTMLIMLATPVFNAAPAAAQTEPINDNVANAIDIAPLPYSSGPIDVTLATSEPTDPTNCYGNSGHSVWFTFTPTETMMLGAIASSSNFNPIIDVYTGSPGAFHWVGCGFLRTQFQVTAGVTYYMMVTPYTGYGGVFSLSVDALPPPPANDDVADALTIGSLPYTSPTIDSTGATTEATDPTDCTGASSHSVWFTYTPTEDTAFVATASGTLNLAAVGVYLGSPGSFTKVGCSSVTVRVEATAGLTYYIVVGDSSRWGGILNLSVVVPPPPPDNDNFASAAVIDGLPYTSPTIDTVGATTEATDPTDCYSDDQSVWFAYTPSENTLVLANTNGSSYTAFIGVYLGSPGSFSQVTCGVESAQFEATAGTTYYFMVAGSLFGGDLVFNVIGHVAPTNDNVADAMEIGSLPYTSPSIDTTKATTEPTDPTGCGTTYYSVWFTYTPAVNMTLIATTDGSDYGPLIGVYTATPSDGTQVTCGYGSVQFQATAGTTYYFMVASYSSEYVGTLVFNVSGHVTPANDDVANAITIDSLPYTSESIDTAGATVEVTDPTDCFESVEHTVWFTYTPTTNQVISATSSGSSYSPVIGLFSGSPGAFTLVGCGYGSAQFEVTAGTTYYFMAATSYSDGGTLTFSVSLITPPANDNVADAIDVTSLPYTIEAIDTTGATRESTDPTGCYGPYKSVWFTFTPTQNLIVNADTFGSNYDTVLSVWTGSPGSFTQVACNDEYNGSQSLVTFQATAGTTYYFMVASYYRSGSNLALTFSVSALTPPVNDSVAGAIDVSPLPYTSETIDTTGATSDASDPTSCYTTSHSVWFTYTATENQSIRATTPGSSYSPVIGIYTGSPGSFTQVACDYGTAQIQATAGTTYYFMVAGGASGGTLIFSMSVIQPPANDNFADAIDVSPLPYSSGAIDTTAATSEASDPPSACANELHNTVWFTYTPSATMKIAADASTSSYYTTVLGVYTYDEGTATFTEVACGVTTMVFEASAGQTYYLMVADYYGSGGTLNLSVSEILPPANDNVADAIDITSLPYTSEDIDTTGATAGASDPTSCGSTQNSVWFKYTATASEVIGFYTSASFDSLISVYTGSPGDFTQVACGSYGVTAQVTSGTTYYIMVADYYGGGGSLVLSVDALTPPANDTFANAIDIASLPYYDDGIDASGATMETSDPTDCGTPYKSIWFKYTPASDMTIQASVSSDYSTLLGVYTYDESTQTFTQVACSPGGVTVQVTVGTTYYFMLAATDSSAMGYVYFSADVAPRPPANDNFADAIDVSTLPYNSGEIDATGATTEAADPTDCGTPSNSVWFKYTAASELKVRASTYYSYYETVMGVYTYDPETLAFTNVACGFGDVTFQATADTSYYIMVASRYGYSGTLYFSADVAPVPPISDNFADAIDIAPLPYSSGGIDTNEATTETTDPTTCYGAGHSVWFKYTPAYDDTIDANTFGSNYDTVLSVWTGSPGDFTQVACNDDSESTQSAVSFPVTAGTTYYLMAAGYGGGAGILNLSVTGTVVPPITTTTTASNAAVTFSPDEQTVNLSATVTNGEPINVGTVTFTLKSGDPVIGIPVLNVPVTDGVAEAVYTIPAGTNAGDYTILAEYSGGTDGTNTFGVSSDDTHILTVTPATATITLSNTVQTYDGTPKSVTVATEPNGLAYTVVYAQGGTVVESPAAPGIYDVDVTIDAGQNYSGSTTGTLTIEQAALDHITLSPATATITAGTSQSYTAEAFDIYGTDLGDVTASTTFTFTGPTSGTCDGASCAFTTAGDYTITGTYSGTTGTASLTVTPAALDHFDFSPISSPQVVGVPFSITVTAQDAYDNTVAGYAGTVSLSVTSGTISPATSGAFSNGNWTGNVTLNTDGTQTITATDGTHTGTSNSFTVNPAAPVGAAPVAQDTSATVTTGGSVNITLAATDSDSASLTFSVSQPTYGSVTDPGKISCKKVKSGGVTCSTTVTYTSDTSGYTGTDTFVFTVSDGVNTDTGTGSLTVNPAPVQTLHLAFTVASLNVRADIMSHPLTLQLVDQNGKAVAASDDIIVTLTTTGSIGGSFYLTSSGDPITTDPPTVTIAKGSNSVTFYYKTSSAKSSGTIEASADGYPTPATIAVTVR